MVDKWDFIKIKNSYNSEIFLRAIKYLFSSVVFRWSLNFDWSLSAPSTTWPTLFSATPFVLVSLEDGHSRHFSSPGLCVSSLLPWSPSLVLLPFLLSSLKLASCKLPHGFLPPSALSVPDHVDCGSLALSLVRQCLVSRNLVWVMVEVTLALSFGTPCGQGMWCKVRAVRVGGRAPFHPLLCFWQALHLEQITYFIVFLFLPLRNELGRGVPQ